MGIPDDDIDYVFTVPTTGGENAKLIVREAAVNVRKFEQLFFYLAGSCGIKINIQVIELQVTAVGKTKSSGWDIVNQIPVSFEHVKLRYVYGTDCQLFSDN